MNASNQYGCRCTIRLTENWEELPLLFAAEDPPGTFCALVPGRRYFCVVQEDAAQLRREAEQTRQKYGLPSSPALMAPDQYTAAFKEVLEQAKAEGVRRGFEGEMLAMFVQGQVDKFNSA